MEPRDLEKVNEEKKTKEHIHGEEQKDGLQKHGGRNSTRTREEV